MDRIDFDYRYDHEPRFKDRIDSKYDSYTVEMILRLSEIRKEKKMTTQDLAYESDMSISAISNIENFKQIPTYKTLQKIAKCLGVKIEIKVTAIE